MFVAQVADPDPPSATFTVTVAELTDWVRLPVDCQAAQAPDAASTVPVASSSAAARRRPDQAGRATEVEVSGETDIGSHPSPSGPLPVVKEMSAAHGSI